ncbi:hypothetical protein GCM10019016_008970 [Streptomyces prasinosporus]|uniref:DUF5709 domain-containing protein n=1 Tax=Streptomyces prasinosporus TaxID=68256 RepID=A0ABP6TGX6_9ACTN|nr:hypothetical protein GCM10010332_64740 [Streptomyces albogriseolus]
MEDSDEDEHRSTEPHHAPRVTAREPERLQRAPEADHGDEELQAQADAVDEGEYGAASGAARGDVQAEDGGEGRADARGPAPAEMRALPGRVRTPTRTRPWARF